MRTRKPNNDDDSERGKRKTIPIPARLVEYNEPSTVVVTYGKLDKKVFTSSWRLNHKLSTYYLDRLEGG